MNDLSSDFPERDDFVQIKIDIEYVVVVAGGVDSADIPCYSRRTCYSRQLAETLEFFGSSPDSPTRTECQIVCDDDRRLVESHPKCKIVPGSRTYHFGLTEF